MRDRIRRGRRRALACALALGLAPVVGLPTRPAAALQPLFEPEPLPAPAADDPGWPHDPGEAAPIPLPAPAAARTSAAASTAASTTASAAADTDPGGGTLAANSLLAPRSDATSSAVTAIVATAAPADDTDLPARARVARLFVPIHGGGQHAQACPGRAGCDGMSSGVFRPPEISIAQQRYLSTHHAAVTAGLARVDAKVAEAFLAEEATALLYAESRASCYATQAACEAACPCADWAHFCERQGDGEGRLSSIVFCCVT